MAGGIPGIDPQALSMLGVQPGGTGMLDKVGNFLSHPAVQGLLGAYFGAISSPRRMGIGTALGRGGLTGLASYGGAQSALAQEEAARAQGLKSAFDISKDMRREKAIQGLPEKERSYAEIDPSLIGTIHKDDQITAANQNTFQQFMQLHPGNATAAVLAKSAVGAPSYISVADLEKSFGEIQQNPLKLQEVIASIQQKQTATQKEEGDIALQPLTAQEKLAQIGAAGTSQALARANLGMVGPRTAELEASTALKKGELAALPAKTAGGQMAKINTDLARFLTTNPSGMTTDHKAQVERAIAYAANLNPGAPPEQIRAAAEALVPESGMLSGVKKALTGGGEAGAATPKPAGAVAPSATSLSGKPIYTWPDGTHHYSPPPGT